MNPCHELIPVTSPAARAAGRGARQRLAGQGLARSLRLFRLFRREQSDPGAFYAALADDALAQLAPYTPLAGQTVIDIGGGAGYFTAAFRAAGAHSFVIEPDQSELLAAGPPPAGAVLGDGYWLPVADGSADICFSSNVLEHVADPAGFIDEMIRITRPGGLIYLSFTNWYSPWGGHEMSPWHLLGAGFAARRYRRRAGRDPKHAVGVNLFRLHIGPVLRLVRSRADVSVVTARPRYYPRWCAPVMAVPLLREIASWNLLLVLRRAP